MTNDNEATVRHAYHTAEGSVLDVAGFVGSCARGRALRVLPGEFQPKGDPP